MSLGSVAGVDEGKEDGLPHVAQMDVRRWNVEGTEVTRIIAWDRFPSSTLVDGVYVFEAQVLFELNIESTPPGLVEAEIIVRDGPFGNVVIRDGVVESDTLTVDPELSRYFDELVRSFAGSVAQSETERRGCLPESIADGLPRTCLELRAVTGAFGALLIIGAGVAVLGGPELLLLALLAGSTTAGFVSVMGEVLNACGLGISDESRLADYPLDWCIE